MRVAAVSVFLSEERAQLTQWARSKTVSVRLSRRAQIVLGAADGLDNETIAARWATCEDRCGAVGGCQRHHGTAGVAPARVEAASGASLQSLARPAVYRKAQGHRRHVHGPSGARAGAATRRA